LLQGDELVKPGAVRALRCQLRRANPFYADTPAPASQLAPKQLQVRIAIARVLQTASDCCFKCKHVFYQKLLQRTSSVHYNGCRHAPAC
jgi:hypothetical protein